MSRSTWLLSLVMLVNRSGTMVVPFMTIYVTEKLHYSIAKAGFIMGLFGLGSIAGALIGGRLTDKLGFYRIQLFALSGGGCLFMLLGQMQNFVLISIFVFVLSLVNESFRPANAAAIAHYSDSSNRTRSYSLNRLAINLGWAAGGALGGFIASHNYQLLFWVDGFTNIFAAILLIIFLRPSVRKDEQLPTEEITLFTASPYKDKKYLLFILLTTVFATYFFQYFTTLPVYFKQDLKLSFLIIGLLLSLNGLIIAFVEMILVYLLENTKTPMRIITIGVAMVGISFLILNIFHSYPLFASFTSMILITFGEMLSMPFMNSFWVSRTTNANRGAYASLFTIAFSIGQILGPLVGGQVVERFGFSILWWIIGIAGVINGIGFLFLQDAKNRWPKFSWRL